LIFDKREGKGKSGNGTMKLVKRKGFDSRQLKNRVLNHLRGGMEHGEQRKS